MVTDRLVDWFNTLPTAVLLLCLRGDPVRFRPKNLIWVMPA